MRRRKDAGRYAKCEHCSYVGDTRKMQSHNDMTCMRRAMGIAQMSECGPFARRPKAPTPDRRF